MQDTTIQQRRKALADSERWVIKIGSSLLTKQGSGLDLALISQRVDDLTALRRAGKKVVLVSSGAVAEGVHRLGWRRRPHALYELQAAAAVGQMGLVQAYESAFQRHGIHTAQVLLTHDDLADRRRYINARSTLRALLGLGIVPVVNENDTVAVEEIRFGDNDTLAASVANLVEADLLVILTDQPGMYEADPRAEPDAPLVRECRAGDPEIERKAAAGRPGALGRGGMLTKAKAAERAARSGTATIIGSGRDAGVLAAIAAGDAVGTLFYPNRGPLAARKQWLAGQLQVRGRLVIDDGAARVLRQSGRSLLAVGVTAVEGAFSRGEMVVCVDAHGAEVARGLVNYSAAETQRILGRPSEEIERILGYVDEPELVHRDNLILS